MGRPSLTEEQIRDMKIRLIHATQEMLFESGISSVSIRNVGQKLHINSATIYRYFKDVDELILFACVDDLQNYVVRLIEAGIQSGEQYDEEFYLLSWKLFCEEAFRKPEQFHKLFFSKHSNKLDDIIREYYQLFPNTLNELPVNRYEMISSSNVLTRNLLILRPIVESYNQTHFKLTLQEYSVNEVDLQMINEMTISYFYSLLMEVLHAADPIDPDTQTGRMLNGCRYLLHTLHNR